MIDFHHIYKSYSGDVCALNDVNLYIEKGEFVFLIGPSGAGKTTLFRLLSAFDHPTSGNLKVAGYTLKDLKAREVAFFRRHIGVVYQDFRLLKRRTVFENVALPLEVRGERQQSMQKRVREILDEVGLVHKADRYPTQLSGGEQQRVAIARALVHHPGILIADEPTGNLDPDLSREIMGLLERVNARGTTVFVATHDHELINASRRRIVEIKNGHIVRDH
ncbi:MAG: cell division ATP-binding protein FtsE [Bdellovibrionaceae bacterium]|nr:cell division ATP-binding protein FtsE [Bdellovibrionales bacterium]MCB9085293.1 cell division ATP-binding protein FtsE [Pseudobdellovibrionaceae bacterium]